MQPPYKSPSPHGRVLIVEDEELIRRLLVIAIGRCGVDVDEAADGVEALEKLATATYDVITLDLMMPRMNGFDLLESARLALAETIPVVFVTTAYDSETIRTVDPAVVHGVVRKPFDVETVAETIAECAKLRASHRAPATPRVTIVRDDAAGIADAPAC